MPLTFRHRKIAEEEIRQDTAMSQEAAEGSTIGAEEREDTTMREEEAEDTTMSAEETAEENVEEREDTTMREEEAEEEVNVNQQDRDLIRLSTGLTCIELIPFHYELLMRRAGVVADAEMTAEEKMLQGFQQLLDMAAANR